MDYTLKGGTNACPPQAGRQACDAQGTLLEDQARRFSLDMAWLMPEIVLFPFRFPFSECFGRTLFRYELKSTLTGSITMLNPEKILGGLLRGKSRSGGMFGKLGAGSVGLGLLGVAMEAAEHYMNKAKTPQSAGPPPSPPGGAPSTPPPQPPGEAPTPPPAPGAPEAAPPSPPAPEATPTEDPGKAVLLIRAMIAAANADGMIDEDERGRILDRLKAVELTPEEHAFITRELLSPCDLDTILSGVKSPETAKQVYAVSLMAIEVDTDAERKHLKTLADRLGLDNAALGIIHRDLGIDRP